jgi:hypothetical protein
LEININSISIKQDIEASELKTFLFESVNDREWIFPKIQIDSMPQSFIQEKRRYLCKPILTAISSQPRNVFEHSASYYNDNTQTNNHSNEEIKSFKDEVYFPELDSAIFTLKKNPLSGSISEELLLQLNESQQEAVKYCESMDVKLLPYEQAEGMEYTRKVISQIKPGESIGIFVGPEGGFDDKEVEAATNAGFKSITMGKRILRTETAGFTMLSWLLYTLER